MITVRTSSGGGFTKAWDAMMMNDCGTDASFGLKGHKVAKGGN